MKQKGRPAKIQSEHLEIIRVLAQAHPLATLGELLIAFREQTGMTVHAATLRKALAEAGVVRVKPDRSQRTEEETRSASKRYGYQERHRPQDDGETYGSSLTDAEWALVKDLFEREGDRGLPPRIARRRLVDACCYVVRTGCAWCRRIFRTGTTSTKPSDAGAPKADLKRCMIGCVVCGEPSKNAKRRPRRRFWMRKAHGIHRKGGISGYDVGKKVKGRKRNLVVDTLGLLLAVTVTSAGLQDRDAGTGAIAKAVEKYPSVQRLYVDSAYAGQWATAVQNDHGINVEVIRHPANRLLGRWEQAGQQDLFAEAPPKTGFTVLPKRWVVEHTHAWNERARRLIMHHDRLPAVSEAWVWLAKPGYRQSG